MVSIRVWLVFVPCNKRYYINHISKARFLITAITFCTCAKCPSEKHLFRPRTRKKNEMKFVSQFQINFSKCFEFFFVLEIIFCVEWICWFSDETLTPNEELIKKMSKNGLFSKFYRSSTQFKWSFFFWAKQWQKNYFIPSNKIAETES